MRRLAIPMFRQETTSTGFTVVPGDSTQRPDWARSNKEMEALFENDIVGPMKEREQQRRRNRERDEYAQKMKELQNDAPKRTRSGRVSRRPQLGQRCVADQATLNLIRVSLGYSRQGNLCYVLTGPNNRDIRKFLLEEIGFASAVYAFNDNTQARTPLNMTAALRELGLTVPDIPQNLKPKKNPKKNPNNLTVMSLNGSKKKRSKK